MMGVEVVGEELTGTLIVNAWNANTNDPSPKSFRLTTDEAEVLMVRLQQAIRRNRRAEEITHSQKARSK